MALEFFRALEDTRIIAKNYSKSNPNRTLDRGNEELGILIRFHDGGRADASNHCAQFNGGPLAVWRAIRTRS